MPAFKTIAVVGSSLAGLRAMEALRREGYEGKLIAIGDEPHRPYDRPPLSKQFLKGAWEADQLALRTQGPEELEVEWRLGQRACALDPRLQQIELDSGERVAYDGLVIATGARARALPAFRDRAGVFTLRSLEDATVLRRALEGSPRVAVLGGGFIGMEVAATWRERGLEVALVEALDVPLVRGLGPQLGSYVANVFRDQGVDLRTGQQAERLEGDTRVEALVLEDGTRIPADVVLVGIGAAPATDWLEGSGLEIGDGVVCDSDCATKAEGVVAAGDVARWQDARTGESQRAEHWTNAVEQSVHAARRLLRGPEVGAYDHVPYVWTDQFHLRIQLAGEVQPGDQMHICHGSQEEGRFIALFGRRGKLSAAVGFKRPRQLLNYRDLLGEGATWQQALALAGGEG